MDKGDYCSLKVFMLSWRQWRGTHDLKHIDWKIFSLNISLKKSWKYQQIKVKESKRKVATELTLLKRMHTIEKINKVILNIILQDKEKRYLKWLLLIKLHIHTKICKTLSLSHTIYKILLQGQYISKGNIIKPPEDNPRKLFSDLV